MTEHNHSRYVEGCYRCDLSRDEVERSMTEQRIDPLEAEAKAAAEKRYELPHKPAKNANERRANMVAHALRQGYVEGYIAGASRPTGETHDEDTLRKVYEELYRAGLSGVEAADAVNQMQNAGILFRERVKGDAKLPQNSEPVSLSGVPETEGDDEREALAELIDSMHDDYAPTYNREGACCGSNIADAILTSDVWRNRHPQIIPIYAMLDVWMALYGTSHPEFDTFYAEHGYAETWARLMHAIRHPQPTEGEPTDAQVLAKIREMHRPKHGETARYAIDDPQAEREPVSFEPYVICDYDKTPWPCKTQRILDGVVADQGGER